MSQIEKQIAEIAGSKTVVSTPSTTITTTAFQLPGTAREQIAAILAARRAAIVRDVTVIGKMVESVNTVQK